MKQKHPKGLYVLSTTEMWERFNFYGMRALLSLFLVNAMLFSERDASLIYGSFLGLSFLTPMIGGYLADNYLGNRRAILLGGSIMGAGQFFLFSAAWFYADNFPLAKMLLWCGLGAIIVGNGLFKPNISSMVGSLYPQNDNRIDVAFTIFYLGINLGSLLGMYICAILGDVKIDGLRVVSAFKWGFLTACGAILLGTLIFLWLRDKYLVSTAGQRLGLTPAHENANGTAIVKRAIFSKKAIVITILSAVIFIILFYYPVEHNIPNFINAFVYSTGIALAGLVLFGDKTTTRNERSRITVLYFISFFSMFFWACFEQAGASLTFIADYQTDTHLFGWEVPAGMVQNANSVFILLLCLPIGWLWSKLQHYKKEPHAIVKQAIGLLLLAGGYALIAARVHGISTAEKIGIVWLILVYFMHSFGELCLSPIGLALVSKTAPNRFASLLMGVWFLSNAAGYSLAGFFSSKLPPTTDAFQKAEKLGIDLQQVLDKTISLPLDEMAKLAKANIETSYPTIIGISIHNLYEFFLMLVIVPTIAGLLLFVLYPKLKKMMHMDAAEPTA